MKLARIGRLLASPTGVLIVLPILVVAVGIVVLVLGRTATRDATDSMARAELAANSTDVSHEIAFALDQAQPMLESLRPLADPELPIAEVAARMRDLQTGRPGVTNVSLGFPSGLMRGTYRDRATGELRVQESRIEADGTHRVNYRLAGRALVVADTEKTTYDVRTRPHYAQAVATDGASWMAPRVYFTSKTTGITATLAVRSQALTAHAATGQLLAVVTVDFDVAALGEFIARAPFERSQTVVFAGDGTILAAPGLPVPDAAAKESRLLRATDYADPAIAALFRDSTPHPTAQIFVESGQYLAAISPIGGTRAGIATPLDWYHATLVPKDVLLGPTHRFERQTLVASAIAVVLAFGIALVFAWNLVRMRRAVVTARAALESAQARARDLGSYRLVSRLGAGGMGEVWRAEHRLLARQAAIKLVRPEALADELSAAKMRERFRREAQTLASMRSRNTIALYDYGVTDDGTFYFVMELLDGLDLDVLVKQHGEVPAARAIQILIQMCNSLAEAHDAGLLHRDIKPANIFVSRAADEVDVVKVLDFGIVSQLGEPNVDPLEAITIVPDLLPSTSGKLTALGAVVGTPGYIPPESVYGAASDARADLYAVGCVAWWLLAGSEVFPRKGDANAQIVVHVTEAVPDLRKRVSGWLPLELEMLVRACLEKDPKDRPVNARSLADQLRAIAIPDDHAWSIERAKAWWYVHRPIDVPVADVTPAVPSRLVVSEAPTVENGPQTV